MKFSTKPLKDLYTELIDRRLWPLAVVLLAAIVAVPMLLTSGSSADRGGSATVVAGKLAAPAVADTAVIATTASGRDLHGTKATNPFYQRGPRKKATKTGSASAAGPGVTSTGGTSSSSSGSTGSGSSGPTSTTTTTTTSTTTHTTYQTASIKLRFGRITSDRKLHGVPRLAALPSTTNPVLIYMGVLRGTKTAVFLVSSDAQAEGDGKCKPSPASCQTVWVKEGQTEFFDVTTDAGTVVQYQLDLANVTYGRTSSRAKAAAGFLKVAPKQTKTTKLSASPPGTATTPAQNRPALGELVWSSALGRVLGVPKPAAHQNHATGATPIVVPVGGLAGGLVLDPAGRRAFALR